MIGLATTFDGWGFMVVTGVAATLGILVALTTLRLPVAVLVAAIPIGAVLFGGPVALRATGLGAGVPDLKTLADVMQGSATGWGELLTTLPNVDLAGPPALVPFLLGYVGSAVACAIALRTRSAGGPLLPLLAVLVVVLLLRRPEGGLLDWYPVGFAAVAIIWIVLRGLEFSAERSDLVRGRSRGRVGRAVAAGVVVAGSLLVAVPLTSGNPSSAGETLRGRAGEVPELDGLDSPLRRFRTFAESSTGSSQNVHRKLLFTVSGVPKGSRVRMLTLDRYDGREWLPGNGTMQGTTDDAFHRMDTRVDNPTKGRPIRAQVTLAKAFRSAWVPTAGSLTSLRFLFTDADSKRDQLRYDLATSTAVVPVGVEQGDDYEFTARLPDDRLTRSMRAWSGPVLSVEGVDRVDPFLRRLQASGAPPMRKVFVLAEHLREYGRYSDGDAPGETQYTAGHDLERLVDDFLLAPRAVGNDEQYASAMALLANRLGVPARVAVGAVVPEDGKVRGEDVHAWVELRVADGSWRVLPTKEFMGRKPPRRDLSPAPKPQLPATVLPEPPEQQTQPEIQRQEQEHNECKPRGEAWCSGCCPGWCCSPSRSWCRWPSWYAAGGAVPAAGPRTGWPAPGGSSSTMRATSACRCARPRPGPPRRGPWRGTLRCRTAPTTACSRKQSPRSPRWRPTGATSWGSGVASPRGTRCRAGCGHRSTP